MCHRHVHTETTPQLSDFLRVRVSPCRRRAGAAQAIAERRCSSRLMRGRSLRERPIRRAPLAAGKQALSPQDKGLRTPLHCCLRAARLT